MDKRLGCGYPSSVVECHNKDNWELGLFWLAFKFGGWQDKIDNWKGESRKAWVPYLNDFSEGVRSFTGEATASQIDGADGGLVLDSLTQHCIETNA